MTKREAVARYNLIIQKLRRKPSSFAELSEYLAIESELQGSDFNISDRTFLRDRQDISSLYNLDIVYDKKRKVYYIDFDDQPEMYDRLLEAFDTFNALNVSDRLSDYIHLEKRRPQGTENLYGLLHAIKNKVQITFTYHKFWEDQISRRMVEPYALKEYRNRWYILANDLKDNKVKSFAMDRIKDLDFTKKKFKLPGDFNVNEHYKYCFGIISPNSHQPEEVILSFTPFQGKYIKSLPLHESQTILKDDEQELVIKLNLFVTHDFFMELLSLGANVKVLQPASLREQIIETYEEARKQY